MHCCKAWPLCIRYVTLNRRTQENALHKVKIAVIKKGFNQDLVDWQETRRLTRCE